MTSLKPSWFVRKVANPAVSAFGMASTLAVKGRTSGAERTVPVNVLEVDGTRYLISPRGETDWVKNLRVAGEGELRHKGSVDSFTAVEVPTEDRPELIAAYREKWEKQVKKLFEQVPDPAAHPTFRLTAVT